MPEHLDNLPNLTDDQARAVGALLTAYGSLAEAATEARLSLGRFLDLIESPEAKAHLDAARRAARRRAEQRIDEAAHAAADILEMIATDAENDMTERRRAATSLLRAVAAPRARRRIQRNEPGGPGIPEPGGLRIDSRVWSAATRPESPPNKPPRPEGVRATSDHTANTPSEPNLASLPASRQAPTPNPPDAGPDERGRRRPPPQNLSRATPDQPRAPTTAASRRQRTNDGRPAATPTSTNADAETPIVADPRPPP